MSARRPALVVVVSDTHCGSYVGLIHPKGTGLPKASRYQPSPVQIWLHEQFMDFIRRAKIAALRRTVYVVLNGDLIDGTPHGSQENITPIGKFQRAIAVAALAPLVELADFCFVVRGTPAHVGQLGENESDIGETLGCERNYDNEASWQELEIHPGGVHMHFQHHPGSGGKHPAHSEVERTLIDRAGEGDSVPRLIVRSHMHLSDDTGSRWPAARGVITPAFCHASEYVYKIGGPKRAHVGGLLVKCNGGEIEDPEILVKYKVARPRAWKEPVG